MTLKEKIENKIKKYKNSIKKDNLDIHTMIEYDHKIEELQWVLAELEKITCQNCKDNDICGRYIRQKYGTCKVTYCSEWEKK